MTLEWSEYKPGETPLDFGALYLFANAKDRRLGLRTVPFEEPPATATHMIKASEILKTVPKPAP